MTTTNRFSGALRWIGLGAAVVAVIGALWMLLREPPTRSERAAAAQERRDSGTPGADRGGPSIAARDVTIDGDGVVEGTIVDEDGQPVTDGRVDLWCLRGDGTVARIRDGALALDDAGHFSGPACRGQVCPQLHHTSQIPAEPWSLDPGSEQTLETRSAPRMGGRVLDPTGAVVADARVTFAVAEDEGPTVVVPVTATQTSTDADGVFSVALITRPPCDPCQRARGQCHEDTLLPVADRVRISARASGWAPGSIEVDVLDLQGELEGEIEVRLREASDGIEGTLVDASGEVLPRAIVLARSESDRHHQRRAEAGDGRFVLGDLGEGPFTVRAIQDGVELVREESVEPGDRLALRLPWPATDIEVQIVDEHGEPWSGVQVRGGPFGRVRSDATGIVRAQRVAPETYIVRIHPPGGRARAYDLEVPAPKSGEPTEIEVEVARGSD